LLQRFLESGFGAKKVSAKFLNERLAVADVCDCPSVTNREIQGQRVVVKLHRARQIALQYPVVPKVLGDYSGGCCVGNSAENKRDRSPSHRHD
jgi:hypothetical protein